MSTKTCVSRDAKNFATIYTYRELTYKLAYGRFEEAPPDDNAVFAQLKAVAKEQEQEVLDIADMVHNKLGLPDYELSKVETFVIPETLNTVWRGIATKGDREVRFYVERP